MPKTTVNEHRYSAFGKSEIGATEHSEMPSPARDLVRPEQRRHL
jgi:hypothetical protein